MPKSVQKITLGEESAATGYETAMADSEPPAEDALVMAEQQPVPAE
jgi:hypothetical protein